jgi:hypothetical protein
MATTPKLGVSGKATLEGTIEAGIPSAILALFSLSPELGLELRGDPSNERQREVRISVAASAASTSPRRVELSASPIGEESKVGVFKGLAPSSNAFARIELEEGAPLWSERFALKAGESRSRYVHSVSNRKQSQALRALDLFDALRAAASSANPGRIERPSATERARFRILANRWVQETEGISVLSRAFLHRPYQQIIGMGPVAIPLLLEELRDRPDHWMFALSILTNTDPARGTRTFGAARVAWLRWGAQSGYLNAD